MEMNLDEIKKMPPKIKALALGVIYIIFGCFYYFFFVQADFQKRSNLQTKLKELEQQVSEKERLASQFAKYAKGLDTLKESFKTALTKLPVRKEIPELLNNIALSGEYSKITFIIFEPQPTVIKPIGGKNAPDQKAPGQKPAEKKPPEQGAHGQKPAENKPGDAKSQAGKLPEGDYYEEIPVSVRINGSYHDTAAFFEKVAKLPRIINIEDVSMENVKIANDTRTLVNTSCVMKTYMFVQKAKTVEEGKKIDETKK